MGSVFSPFYYRARRDGESNPEMFCALNVAVHGPHERAWAFTEPSQDRIQRTRETFGLGESRLQWRGDHLAIFLDEPTLGRDRIQGHIYLYPHAVVGTSFGLDAKKRHRWWAIAPTARIEVILDRPSLRFSGNGYHDANDGDEPLENGFSRWTWTRIEASRGTTVLYDARRRDGSDYQLARSFTPSGETLEVVPPPMRRLPSTGLWQFPRATRSRGRPRVVETLLDSPFYARSIIETDIGAGPVRGVHESLSLDRFATPWMQFMLPYRIRNER